MNALIEHLKAASPKSVTFAAALKLANIGGAVGVHEFYSTLEAHGYQYEGNADAFVKEENATAGVVACARPD